MARQPDQPAMIDLPVDAPIWDRFFTIAPLVLVGTMEEGGHDLAPKHMAMPLGWSNYFCFACSPRHATYRNAERTGAFTVSFPRPGDIVEASLAATPRADGGGKPALGAVPVVPSRVVEGVLVEGAYLWLECRLERLVDGFGANSLVIGQVVAAAVAEGAARGDDADDADVVAGEPLLAYVANGRFAEVRSTLSFPFHTGFSR
jgi:flavin reductase (DIM6/NTAB) family NADH-FMN oxidoreductase RutF